MIEQHKYQQQLLQKQQHLKALFSDLYHEMDVFASPDTGFRLRAEFRFWHDEDDAYFIMYEKGDKKQFYRVDTLPIAHPSINHMMQVIREEALNNDVIRHKLFMVEFLATLSGQMLVTLVYHRPLDEDWINTAKALEVKHAIHLIGRSKKQRIVVSNSYVDEQLTVVGKDLFYRQIEGGFTQPNAFINIKMLEWVQSQVSQTKCKDLLELYCGNGNFTVALADLFQQALATEISKPSVAAAEYNFEHNQINNAKVCRMSSEDFTDALNQVRPFRRLLDKQIELADYDFSHVLVDPPRAGLDPNTLALISRFDNIIYISCNPNTLITNLEQLHHTHKIKKVALFDQFPYTHHIETGVILNKR